MQDNQQSWNLHSHAISWSLSIASAVLVMFFVTVPLNQSARAQTFQVLYSFSGTPDGASPSNLTIDAAGNLYGVASGGGINYNGTVFKLSRENSGWVLARLYSFQGGEDGSTPAAPLIAGPHGSFYSITRYGGGGSGTVYSLSPPATAICQGAPCPWIETVLYRFQGAPDGQFPVGAIVSDRAGNLYGATQLGGIYGNEGLVYELTPSLSGWTEAVVHYFRGGSNDGAQPFTGLIFDQAGSLYGTTIQGGATNEGAVVQLTPNGGLWSWTVLHSFDPAVDGWYPFGGLISDRAGNLYGTTTWAGPNSGGTVYELIRGTDNHWTFAVLYALPRSGGYGPTASVTMDAAGNLFGTTLEGGAFGYGNVFKLTPSGQSWIYTSLHDFTGGNDGAGANSAVVLDTNGNLYSTAGGGGQYGYGVVFELTP